MMAPLDIAVSTTVVANVSITLCVTNRQAIATVDVNQGIQVPSATKVR